MEPENVSGETYTSQKRWIYQMNREDGDWVHDKSKLSNK